jgi:hypothetical protein
MDARDAACCALAVKRPIDEFKKSKLSETEDGT